MWKRLWDLEKKSRLWLIYRLCFEASAPERQGCKRIVVGWLNVRIDDKLMKWCVKEG